MTVLSAFRSHCCQKLEDLGDGAMDTKQYDKAISQYCTLTINSSGPVMCDNKKFCHLRFITDTKLKVRMECKYISWMSCSEPIARLCL